MLCACKHFLCKVIQRVYYLIAARRTAFSQVVKYLTVFDLSTYLDGWILLCLLCLIIHRLPHYPLSSPVSYSLLSRHHLSTSKVLTQRYIKVGTVEFMGETNRAFIFTSRKRIVSFYCCFLAVMHVPIGVYTTY